MLEQGFEIAKTNWKHNLFPHFLIGIFMLAVTPVIMGVKNLGEYEVARIVDMYLCFLGAIIFVPVFLPDGNKDIRDLIASKKTSITWVRMIRLAEAFILVILLLLAFLQGLKIGNCKFDYGKFFYAAFADCVAMGGLGIFLFGITDNVVLAYMAPVLYYVTSMGAGYKHMKGFWLMSLLRPGEAVTAEDKIYLLAAGLCMMAAALVIRWRRRM